MTAPDPWAAIKEAGARVWSPMAWADPQWSAEDVAKVRAWALGVTEDILTAMLPLIREQVAREIEALPYADYDRVGDWEDAKGMILPTVRGES